MAAILRTHGIAFLSFPHHSTIFTSAHPASCRLEIAVGFLDHYRPPKRTWRCNPQLFRSIDELPYAPCSQAGAARTTVASKLLSGLGTYKRRSTPEPRIMDTDFHLRIPVSCPNDGGHFRFRHPSNRFYHSATFVQHFIFICPTFHIYIYTWEPAQYRLHLPSWNELRSCWK